MMWSALVLTAAALPQDRFGPYDPYAPGADAPRLLTPQWVGEAGVDAVIVLSIDDLRAPEPYQRFLHTILERLARIDGRAPVSVMINSVEPEHAQLQTWLERGLSLDVHTLDHPCPLLQGGDLERARSTFERCVDLLNEIPGNAPVAYRMPCCDSINSVSPRFFAEIFEGTTAAGNFLTIDSSVFTVFSDQRFRQHLPADRSFVNTIEDYPFPYVIGERTWELPCVVPSDWEAQHLRGPNHPDTVADWKAALERTVEARGVFTLVFHPHNWIQARQLLELIEHAQETYGERVRFLSFAEVNGRLDEAVGALRAEDGSWTGTRLVDLQGDGLYDVVRTGETLLWDGAEWTSLAPGFAPEAEFGVGPQEEARVLAPSGSFRFLRGAWSRGPDPPTGRGLLVDLDSDGVSEYVLKDAVYRAAWDGSWERLRFAAPRPLLDDAGRDAGVRFVDLDEDGLLDVVASNEHGASVHRLVSMERGWTGGGVTSLPPITIEGRERGAWQHSGHLWWQNEDTAHLANHVDRRSFAELLTAVTPDPLGPAEAISAMQVEGPCWIRLAAAEPLIADPVAFDWDHTGALYVVEMGDYPLGSGAGGRVRRLVDDDGDWEYDSATTFLDGLAFPTGVAPWRDGVLITCAPDILFARDTTGDGVADEVRVVVTGFGEGNQQHRVNGLWWGLDNRYHGANGDSGGTVNGVPLGGRDFALEPDTWRVIPELGRTQFGKTRDDWGNWFGGNNSYPAWHWPLAAEVIARAQHLPPPPSFLPVLPGGEEVHPRAPIPARFNDPGAARRFTSACSPMIYRDDHLPPGFDLFVCEPVHNLVARRELVRDGVSFRAEGGGSVDFLTSSDPTFRPTMIRTGPDGALWVADMSRAVIEHPEWIPDDWEARLDLREGHDRGRLYRIGSHILHHPRRFPSLIDTGDLLAALESRNGWVRDCAQRRILESQEDLGQDLLRIMMSSAHPAARLQALGCMDGLGCFEDLDAVLLTLPLRDEDPRVRRAAVRLAADQAELLVVPLTRLADDPDAGVRMQLASTLGELSGADSGQLLARLLDRDGEDQHARFAALSSLHSSNLDACLAAVLKPERRRDVLLCAARAPWGDPSRSLARAPGDDAERLGHLAAMLRVRLDLSLVGLEDLVLHAQDPDCDLDLVDRLRILERAGEAVPTSRLVQVLVAEGAPMRLVATRVEPQVAELLIASWRSLTPGRRREALTLLLARPLFVEQVLTALESGALVPSDLDAHQRELCVERATDAERARQVLTSPPGDRAAVVTEFLAAMDGLTGDALAGREVFRARCAACHRLDGEGSAVGPDLRALSDRSSAALLVAILDPNRAVEARYRSYTARTWDGVLITGVVAEETETSVTLRGAGVDEVLLRSDLEHLVGSERSQMPEGLEADLTPQDLADLCAYLQGAGVARRVFTGNTPRVALEADGVVELPASIAEIFGPSLVFEERFQNLGFWHSTDDLAAWSVELERGGTFEVELSHACPSQPGANALVLEGGGEGVRWTVAPTGSWETYSTAHLGTLRLAPGRSFLRVRAAEGLEGYLLDLQGLRLRRVE